MHLFSDHYLLLLISNFKEKSQTLIFLMVNIHRNKIKYMFNRHTYERYEHLLEEEEKKERQSVLMQVKRKRQTVESTEKYKGRVRDFLVKMATKPLVLGQYIPPIKNIIRKLDETKNLANAQLYINGFKTNKERLQRAASDNKILDYTPTPVSALNHEYRSRHFDKEIQPGMRFQGNHSPKNDKLESSRATTKLPSISQRSENPEMKMHFKGIEELGNKLKSMQQSEGHRIGLINKLQAVYGGGEVTMERASFDVLLSCRLTKSKTVGTLKTKSFKTDRSQ